MNHTSIASQMAYRIHVLFEFIALFPCRYEQMGALNGHPLYNLEQYDLKFYLYFRKRGQMPGLHVRTNETDSGFMLIRRQLRRLDHQLREGRRRVLRDDEELRRLPRRDRVGLRQRRRCRRFFLHKVRRSRRRRRRRRRTVDAHKRC